MLGMFSHTVYGRSNNNCEAQLIKVRKLVSVFINKQAIPKGALAQLIAIANACPYQEGPAVYEARSVLARLSNRTYSNPCEMPDPTPINNYRIAALDKDVTFIENKKLLTIYPNPANDVLNVILANNGEGAIITIKNYLGQTVLNKVCSQNNVKLNISDLSKGLYIVDVAIADAHEYYKFIKE